MQQRDIIEEVQTNFLESSYDVNAHRAFPDVRDGLKPSQRYCLWEMYVKKYTNDKPHVKCAKVASAVIGDYWPHSDQSMYGTLVGMAQSFSNNIPEIDFHGASGNIILGADSYASSRYTECRLSKMAEEGLFKGIDKDTVPMIWNYSEDLQMPLYLPAVFPRLLVNGTQGIGVSIANLWTLHNFQETAELIIDYIRTGQIDYDNYWPDYPTGGTIINKSELGEINRTGRGKVMLRANYRISGKKIDFYEIPYQTCIEGIIEQIKENLDKGNINGLKSVFNKSDKNKISLTVECGRGVDVQKVLTELFQYTDLRTQINVNQNGIISKTPVLLNLNQVIDVYLEHNLNCIKNEYTHDKEKAEKRLHILSALLKALENIEDVIEVIKSASNTSEAARKLQEKYEFTSEQVKAILDMKLSRLAHLEKEEIKKEKVQKEKEISVCEKVIGSEKERTKIFIKRLSALMKSFGTERKTKVIQEEITKTSKKKKKSNDPAVITFNPVGGYIQKIPASKFKRSDYYYFNCRENDLFIAFSDFGRTFRLSARDFSFCEIGERGSTIGPKLELLEGEKIIFVCPNRGNEKHPYIFFAFDNGKVKKCPRKTFIGTNRNLRGMKATNIESALIGIAATNGDIVHLKTELGEEIFFAAEEVTPTNRGSGGMFGIKLKKNDKVTEMKVLPKSAVDPKKIQKKGSRGKKMLT